MYNKISRRTVFWNTWFWIVLAVISLLCRQCTQTRRWSWAKVQRESRWVDGNRNSYYEEKVVMIWFLILLKSVVKFPLTSDIPTSPCMKHKDQGSLAPRRLHSSSARLLFAELLQISSSFPTVISYPLVAFGEGSALFLPFSDEERSVPGLLLWPPL